MAMAAERLCGRAETMEKGATQKDPGHKGEAEDDEGPDTPSAELDPRDRCEKRRENHIPAPGLPRSQHQTS